ncbi:MAG: glycine--tRNA ligase subunit beta, partial [Bryobacteraceae bacterium]|nr:glycine--tRNA ligase subunit beta [Bryobacteraceae bacterium]
DSTPRRLVLRAEALDARQADREELVMGPPKAAGEGAAQGFARKNACTMEDLLTETTPKGEYFAIRRKIEGRAAGEILAGLLPALIAKIPWPKAMFWTGRNDARFIRPIRWIAALLGDSIVEFEIAGVRSGANSRGHRRLGADELVFDHATYEERLEKNGVILSAEKRRKRIQDGIKKLLRGKGLKLIPDAALLEDIVYLTEFPTPIMGGFREEFLELPQEVLSTVMRHHQRYFTLQRADGTMAPNFIAVMNIKADRKGYVQKGNERVLEARFNDARFFWQSDLKKPLPARVPDLAHVTFQAKLGSYLEKTERVKKLARELAEELGQPAAAAERAAELSKTDLTTDMVKELTELQGVMGGLYAREQGEPEEVWRAIYEHYLPQSMEDPIPATAAGRILSLADKLDTLRSCFSIGMAPTGSKDPFALRRAAQGVVKLLVEGKMRLPLAGMPEDLREFMLDRARYYFKDIRGFAYDEINAVFAAQSSDLVDAEARLFALKLVRQTENFEPLAASFKRIRNILKQAAFEGGDVTPELLEAGPEKDLYDEAGRVLAAVEQYRKSDDYMQALAAIATLRPVVDRFFDSVLVNAPDEAVRRNRLSLLDRLFRQVSSIADFSEIVTSSSTE